MKKENSVLMDEAKASLKGRWPVAIAALFVISTLSFAINFIPKMGAIASLIISGPVTLGIAIFSLKLSRNQDMKFEDIFTGFNHFFISLKAYIVMIVYVFLWALLLIIPGIVKAIAYSMTFFILADDPTLGAREALKKSRAMMNGYKWKYFFLNLRFLGWALLCILTLGIGFLWLIPYVQVTLAKFYEDLKNNPTPTTPPAQTQEIIVKIEKIEPPLEAQPLA